MHYHLPGPPKQATEEWRRKRNRTQRTFSQQSLCGKRSSSAEGMPLIRPRNSPSRAEKVLVSRTGLPICIVPSTSTHDLHPPYREASTSIPPPSMSKHLSNMTVIGSCGCSKRPNLVHAQACFPCDPNWNEKKGTHPPLEPSLKDLVRPKVEPAQSGHNLRIISSPGGDTFSSCVDQDARFRVLSRLLLLLAHEEGLSALLEQAFVHVELGREEAESLVLKLESFFMDAAFPKKDKCPPFPEGPTPHLPLPGTDDYS